MSKVISNKNTTELAEHLRYVAERLAGESIAGDFPAAIQFRTTCLVDRIIGAIFPHLAMEPSDSIPNILADLRFIEAEISGMYIQLARHRNLESTAKDPGLAFVESLPELRRQLKLDAQAILDGDPAAISVDEVILAYPGFMATVFYRVSHCLWDLQLPLVPRLISNIAHGRTGIDIHPAATIGHGFCIDHGTGIVIGETAVIGNGVKLYQGVTLGALSVQKGLAQTKRHPTIEDNVVVYANATILGGDTVIGHDCVVSGNAFISESVPAFSFALRNGEFRPRRAGQMDELEYYI